MKPAVRTLPGVDLGEAIEVLRRHGFHDHEGGGARVVMKKPGLRFAFRAHQRPLEALLVDADDALQFELDYDVFVALDTGDLEQQADRLAQAIA